METSAAFSLVDSQQKDIVQFPSLYPIIDIIINIIINIIITAEHVISHKYSLWCINDQV